MNRFDMRSVETIHFIVLEVGRAPGEKSPQSAIRPVPALSGNPQSKGFTLIEIVITIVLIGIISGLAALIILQGARIYTSEADRSNVNYQAKLAVERMEREVRLISSATTTDIWEMSNNDLQFCDINRKAVRYQLDGSYLKRYELAACSSSQPLWGSWYALSPQIDVANSSFVYYQQDGTTFAVSPATLWYVEINLIATQGSETLRLRTRAHPRNF